MTNGTIVSGMALLMGIYFWWGFRILPHERWQILATVPGEKQESGHWHGVNFTWYGLLTANAYLVAVAVALILMGSVGVPPLATALLATSLLICCVPASRIVARIVEKKAHTFTVGGAVFVGILLTPVLVKLVDMTAGKALSFTIPTMAAYAAIAIAYAFGEGLGRMACISFGCCYGKPVSECSTGLQRIFRGWHFVFHGSTKKIAYADNLEGVKVVPIQAITALLYSVCALATTALFLAGHFIIAFLIATIVTQGWRSLSEILRADYRGAGKISAYQIMGIIGVLYALGMAYSLEGQPHASPDISTGLTMLWSPAILLFLQGIWLTIFLYTGRSTVTWATVAYHVHHERV